MSEATKNQKEYVDHGFGFPVKLVNVPMVKVRGHWTPKINYNELAQELLEALAQKPTRLTGNEIRFIRLQSEMTLTAFGGRFGVSHAAVSKWEDFGDRPTNMAWAAEKDVRLFVALKKQGDRGFAKLYRELEKTRDAGRFINAIDAQPLAA